MRRIPLAIGILGFIGFLLGLSANSLAQGTFTVFDPPGSLATTPSENAINPAGQIAGYYLTDSGSCSATNSAECVVHAFLRNPDGTIIPFDVPGAGSGLDQGTVAADINPAGQIVGFYVDGTPEQRRFHGFLRNPGDSIITFDVPGSPDTEPQAINPRGQIVGFYADASSVLHGFLRNPNGTIISFDPPEAGSYGGDGTEALSINPAGQITGIYTDAGRITRGFLRDPDGTIISFDPDGSVRTFVSAINPRGQIVGNYYGADNGSHGFLREPDGTILSFDPPGAVLVIVLSINPRGQIVGYYYDANNLAHGFLREPDGRMISFDAPGADGPPKAFPSSPAGTFVTAINPAGEITGYYSDAVGYHGLVWIHR